MAFSKTADVPVESILCSCGAEVPKKSSKCAKCGRELIPADLRTFPQPADTANPVGEV